MGKYKFEDDVPIEIQKKRKAVLGSVSMSGLVFDKIPIYVVSDEEYKKFWSIEGNRRKYQIAKHSTGSGKGAGTFFGILLNNPNAMLVSYSALLGAGRNRWKKGDYPAYWAGINFEDNGQRIVCQISQGDAINKLVPNQNKNVSGQDKVVVLEDTPNQDNHKEPEQQQEINANKPDIAKLNTVTICLADRKTIEAIKEYRAYSKKNEFVDCRLLLRAKNGEEKNIEGLYYKARKIHIVFAWDFVLNDISTMQYGHKYYSIGIKDNADTRNLPSYLVVDESPERVNELLRSQKAQHMDSDTDTTGNQPSKADENSKYNVRRKVCVVSSQDFEKIERLQVPEIGDNAKLKEFVFRRQDHTGFMAKCVDNGEYLFASALSIMDENILLKDSAYIFNYGYLYSEGPNSSVPKINIISGRKMVAKFLQGQRGQVRNGLDAEEKKPSVEKPSIEKEKTKQERPQFQTAQAIDISKTQGYEPGRKVWNGNINLSTLDADKTIMLFSRKCHCSKCARRFSQDTIVNCTAFVVTHKGRMVPVTVQYCSGCKSFYMNYEVYAAYIRKYGRLRFNCEIDQSNVGRYSDIGFADDSFLSRAGYSVKASISRRKRQIVLAELLESGQATKWEITEKITEFIRLRKNNPDMANAVACWEEDIAFVADYKADAQTDVGIATIKQVGKIAPK